LFYQRQITFHGQKDSANTIHCNKTHKENLCILCQPLLTISGGEGWKKRLQNAQPQKELLRSTGDWGVPQQAASGKVDSQKHRLLVQSYW